MANLNNTTSNIILLAWCKHNCGFGFIIIIIRLKHILIKIGTITINIFFANEKQVYLFLQCKNSCLGIQQTLGKHFLPPAGGRSVFPAKSCPDAWRSGSWLARGQMNTVDKAKFHSPIHSIFEALVVQYAVGCCHGEELGLFYWPMTASGIALFSVSQWSAEHYFSDVIVSLGFRKL